MSATDTHRPQGAPRPLDGLDETFRGRVEELLEASGGRIWVVSARRTPERQQQLWEEALRKYGDPEIADNWVARPGTSNHEDGTAVDFDGDLTLLARLAPRYGLHRPMKNEPWHWEPAAQASSTTGRTTLPEGGVVAEKRDAPFYMALLMGTLRGDDVRKMGRFKAAAAESTARSSTTSTSPAASGSDVDRFLASLRKKESGGNYQIKGPSTRYGRASGAYQYLDSTWNGRHGYRSAADAPPAIQDMEARKDVERLYQQFGDWKLVAIAWHAGAGVAARARRTGRAGTSDRLQGTDEYADEVVRGMAA